MFKEPVEVLPNTNYTAYATLKVSLVSKYTCTKIQFFGLMFLTSTNWFFLSLQMYVMDYFLCLLYLAYLHALKDETWLNEKCGIHHFLLDNTFQKNIGNLFNPFMPNDYLSCHGKLNQMPVD